MFIKNEQTFWWLLGLLDGKPKSAIWFILY